MEGNNNNYVELQPGTGLAGGKYVIEKKIGEGGFGITYRAMQTGLNRAVCIKEYFLAGRCVRDVQAKTIHLQGAGEELFEKYRAAFVKEAQTLAALHHQGIVEVIDIFDENNTSYMVMPFIEGRSLQSIVEKNGPLSYPEAVNYIGQVANAVGYIHDRHILHRDIKPDNIMITADYKAVLIDFGSAREFEEDKTQAHTSMLTHGYAPTEQYTRTSRKGAYTDIYAIGATLYFVLTGHVPVEAAARITEAMPEPKQLNPDLPDEANRTIMKAMQLKPADRHQSIAEFMDDLRNVKPSVVQDKGVKESGGSGSQDKTFQQPKPAGSKTLSGASQQTTASGKASTTVGKDAGTPLPPATSQQPKAKSSKPAVWIIVAASVVALGVGGYFLLSGKNPHLKEAQANVERYNRAVSDCNRLIGTGSNENPEPLMQARSLLDSVIRPMDSAYADVMMDVYKRSLDIEDHLYPKLESAAKVWADDARRLIMNGSDPEDIIEALEYSLSIFDDPHVREELRAYKESQGVTIETPASAGKNAGTSSAAVSNAPSTADDGDRYSSGYALKLYDKTISEGSSLYKKGEYEGAIKVFERALSEPGLCKALDKYQLDEITDWLEKSKRKLINQNEPLIANNPTSQEQDLAIVDMGNRSDKYYHMGIEYYKRGKYRDAIKSFNQSIHPNLSTAQRDNINSWIKKCKNKMDNKS